MKKILALMFLSVALQAGAQQSRLFPTVHSAVSFNPFALAEIDFTLLGGYEHKIKPRIFLATEAGYIFSSLYVGTDNDGRARASGFMIRPSIKWFVADNDKFYLQPQFFYKQVTHHLYDWLGKEAVGGVPSYQQLQNFNYKRSSAGFNAVVGFALPLDQHKKGFIDLYMGLGLRRKWSKVVGEPRSVYRNDTGVTINDSPDANSGIFPSVPAGIRFIYAIR